MVNQPAWGFVMLWRKKHNMNTINNNNIMLSSNEMLLNCMHRAFKVSQTVSAIVPEVLITAHPTWPDPAQVIKGVILQPIISDARQQASSSIKPSFNRGLLELAS